MSSKSTRPLLKFPIDLCAHVFYDAYQRISTEKSYKNYKKLCETMGNEAISYEEYEYLFNQYLEEDEREFPDIRGCILSDVINGKSAEKSIDDLCNAFKYHKIDTEDHDYWYNRFDSGHLFTRVTFSDLPEDVISEIVEKCDIKSYLNLRKVSHALRNVIDQLRPSCSDIKVHCGEDRIFVDLNDADSEHIDILKFLLRNPKLRLESFQFTTWFRVSGIPHRIYKKRFFDLLHSLDHKIHAEKCAMNVVYEKDVVKVLQCFKPGTLKVLEISTVLSKGTIDEVVKMDQWKLAKHLYITTEVFPPIENIFHFSTFVLRLPPITLEDMVKLCENASKSNNFEYCKVEIQRRFRLETIKRVLNLQPTASPQIYSIPTTNVLIQVSIDFIGFESYKIYKA